MHGMEKSLAELFAMLKAAEVEIKKEHQVLMVNKSVDFKKTGRKGKLVNPKKGGKRVASPPKGAKLGFKAGVVCYYCKGEGHWKRNCPKYLEDKKSGKIVMKEKGIFDIHVIDVYLTSARSNTWVFDTGSVANICNSQVELQNKRDLMKDEVTMRVGNGQAVQVLAVGTFQLRLPS